MSKYITEDEREERGMTMGQIKRNRRIWRSRGRRNNIEERRVDKRGEEVGEQKRRKKNNNNKNN